MEPHRSPGSRTDRPAPEPDPVAVVRYWRRVRGLVVSSMTIGLAVVVSSSMIFGVYSYTRLGGEQNELRGEIGKVRSEVTRMRQQLVRKDEFSSRTLAAHALMKEVESATNAARDASIDRLNEQKLALGELKNATGDLKQELTRLRTRLDSQNRFSTPE